MMREDPIRGFGTKSDPTPAMDPSLLIAGGRLVVQQTYTIQKPMQISAAWTIMPFSRHTSARRNKCHRYSESKTLSTFRSVYFLAFMTITRDCKGQFVLLQ
jgi:hypothetical protein